MRQNATDLAHLALYITVTVGLATLVTWFWRALRGFFKTLKVALIGIEAIQMVPKQVETLGDKLDTQGDKIDAQGADISTLKGQVATLTGSQEKMTDKLGIVERDVAILKDRDSHVIRTREHP